VRLVRLIGVGGQGVVWEGALVRDGRESVVCVKLGKAATEGARNWEGEVKALQRLDHPHIVGIVLSGLEPMGEDREGRRVVQPVLVMEWLSGGSLESEREAVRAADKVRVVLVQVCGALA